MVQGTGSHVGKSVLCAALCRLLRDMGLRVAPFKAQNMALNSAVTPEGGEIGRAQAHQAEAAGVAPTTDMNPILLKPTGDRAAQVIIHGRVHAVMSAAEYHAFKKEAARFVLESYNRLASGYDIIVIEGAGSPAEINLRENDLANMGVAEMTGSPVVLTGDIDRGGVFAALAGTMELLSASERERVKGFIINKFRGDIALLKPGLDFLTNRTGVPVLGVVPYMRDLCLPDEDGVSLDSSALIKARSGVVRIAVIRLPRISNFTDFDPFKLEPDVELVFVDEAAQLDKADCVIIPGSKNTIEDLCWLKDKGFDRRLKQLRNRGVMIIGLCGGFQMLGKAVKDPHGVESGLGNANGLGLLNVETTLTKGKKTHQVEGLACLYGNSHAVAGYEIHMGETNGSEAHFSMITRKGGASADVPEGAISDDKAVWGTYIHGVFDADGFRTAFLDGLREKKGLAPALAGRPFAEAREASIAAFARQVGESLDMGKIMGIIG